MRSRRGGRPCEAICPPPLHVEQGAAEWAVEKATTCLRPHVLSDELAALVRASMFWIQVSAGNSNAEN